MQFLAPLLPAAIGITLAISGHSGFAAPTPPASSSPPKALKALKLDLQSAIQAALEKNLAIRVDSFGPEIAKARRLTESGAFDPELIATFEQITRRASTDPSAEYRSSSTDLGIGGLTPIGTTYRVGANSASFDDYQQYNFGASLSINQPLLRGFGTDVNLASLRIARVNVVSSEWAFRQQVMDVVGRTVAVYNALYAAQRQYDAARRSRDNALALEKDERNRAALGVRIGLDVTTARAEAVAREEAVLLAQQAIENNERYLKQLVTDDTQTLLSTQVIIAPPPTPFLGPIDIDQALVNAFAERPDYQQALLELKIRDINIVVARNGILPRLDLYGSLNLLGVTRDDLQSSFGFDSATAPSSWSAGITFRLPIPNRSARGRRDAAKLVKAQSLVDLQRMEQAIIVDVANAAGQIETARKRVQTSRQAQTLAEESLAAGNERLKAGSATAFEVLELQRKLTDSEASVIKSEADYRVAISEFDRKTGTILTRNAITIGR